MTISGKIDDAAIFRGDRIGWRHGRAADEDFSGDRGETGKGADEILLTIAFDAGKSDDLSWAELQIDALQPVALDIACDQHRLGIVDPCRLVGKYPFTERPMMSAKFPLRRRPPHSNVP